MPTNPVASPIPPKKPAAGALLDAVRDGSTYTVKDLLAAGADVNERDASGNTPLARAASNSNLEIARLLIEKGASVDSRNTHGDTPLMLLINTYSSSNREAFARLLLSKDANLDIKNNDGQTALQLSIQKNRPKVTDMIRETATERKRLAAEFAKAAAEKRRIDTAEKQQRVREAAKHAAKPKAGPKAA